MGFFFLTLLVVALIAFNKLPDPYIGQILGVKLNLAQVVALYGAFMAFITFAKATQGRE
jgi:hypothetical protein